MVINTFAYNAYIGGSITINPNYFKYNISFAGATRATAASGQSFSAVYSADLKTGDYICAKGYSATNTTLVLEIYEL